MQVDKKLINFASYILPLTSYIMETNISLSGEALDLALKVYGDKEDSLTKQLKAVVSRLEELSVQKETIEKELSGAPLPSPY